MIITQRGPYRPHQWFFLGLGFLSGAYRLLFGCGRNHFILIYTIREQKEEEEYRFVLVGGDWNSRSYDPLVRLFWSRGGRKEDLLLLLLVPDVLAHWFWNSNQVRKLKGFQLYSSRKNGKTPPTMYYNPSARAASGYTWRSSSSEQQWPYIPPPHFII